MKSILFVLLMALCVTIGCNGHLLAAEASACCDACPPGACETGDCVPGCECRSIPDVDAPMLLASCGSATCGRCCRAFPVLRYFRTHQPVRNFFRKYKPVRRLLWRATHPFGGRFRR
jgi:hypothetical protein